MAPEGCWASCLRIVDPDAKETVELIELENNEHTTSILITNFLGFEESSFLVVGSVKDLKL